MSFEYWGYDEDELLIRAFDKDDEDGQIECLGRYASFLSERNRHDEAATMWQATYDAIIREGEQGLEPDTLGVVVSRLCAELNELGDHAKVTELAQEEAIGHFNRGLFIVSSDLYVELGKAQKKLGQERVGIMTLLKAVEAANLSNFDYAIARCNLLLAEDALAADLLEIAAGAGTVAVEKYLKMENISFQSRALYILGMAQLGMGERIEAEDALRKAHELSTFLGYKGVVNMTALGLAKLYAALGDYKKAVRWCKKASKNVAYKFAEYSAEARWLAAEITAKYLDPEKGKKLQEKAQRLYSALQIELPRVSDKLF